jgi:hypothetical protein
MKTQVVLADREDYSPRSEAPGEHEAAAHAPEHRVLAEGCPEHV